MVTWCTGEIKSRTASAKAALAGRRLFSSKLDLNLRKKLVKCYIWSIGLYGVATWTLWKADQKYLETFKMWCWRKMEKISWIDRVRKEEVLHRVSEQRNIIRTIKRRKANWIGYILHRNCLLIHIIEKKVGGGIKVTGRQGKRRKQLLYDLKKWVVTRKLNRKNWIALYGDLALEEAMDLSYDKTVEWMNEIGRWLPWENFLYLVHWCQ